MRPAIVYLAQNTRKDLQYGRDSRSMLQKSLKLLYENYNNQFKHDVLIFHEGDFGEKDQVDFTCGRKEIRFIKTHFEIPNYLPKEEIPEIWTGGGKTGFGIGHRHLIRFYAVQIFDILDKLGYDWFMRLDDDSFIHSRIGYDLFKFMEQNDYDYGYRVDIRESEGATRGFGESVLAYIKSENITPVFLNEHLEPAALRVQLKNLIKAVIMRAIRKKKYVLMPSFTYDRWGYYNNFFITRIKILEEARSKIVYQSF